MITYLPDLHPTDYQYQTPQHVLFFEGDDLVFTDYSHLDFSTIFVFDKGLC